ncbi:MAG: hypothetical protein AB1488_07465 [Nitrospirota bacterium]
MASSINDGVVVAGNTSAYKAYTVYRKTVSGTDIYYFKKADPPWSSSYWTSDSLIVNTGGTVQSTDEEEGDIDRNDNVVFAFVASDRIYGMLYR